MTVRFLPTGRQWLRHVAVLFLLAAFLGCHKSSGGSNNTPTTPSQTPTTPTPPTVVTRGSISVTVQDVTGAQSGGYQYTLRLQLKESNNISVTVTKITFTLMNGATAIGTSELDGAAVFPNLIGGGGTAISGTINISDTVAGHPYATAIQALVAFVDASGALSATGTGNVPALPVTPPPTQPPPPTQVAAPTIDQFAVDAGTIQLGQSTTLRWSVANATSVSIDNGIGAVPASGTRSVSPTVQKTTYRITASNSGGSTNRSTVLNVNGSQYCALSEVGGSATAVCNDGSTSQSQNRSGTCSQHSGVRCWVCPGTLCNP